MWNWLFEVTSEYSNLCGERFFVQCDIFEETEEILSTIDVLWGERIEYLGKYTGEEAEILGYDIY